MCELHFYARLHPCDARLNLNFGRIHGTNVTLSWHRGYNYNEINTGKHFEEQF